MVCPKVMKSRRRCSARRLHCCCCRYQVLLVNHTCRVLGMAGAIFSSNGSKAAAPRLQQPATRATTPTCMHGPGGLPRRGSNSVYSQNCDLTPYHAIICHAATWQACIPSRRGGNSIHNQYVRKCNNRSDIGIYIYTCLTFPDRVAQHSNTMKQGGTYLVQPSHRSSRQNTWATCEHSRCASASGS